MARQPRLYYPGALYQLMLLAMEGNPFFSVPPTIDHFLSCSKKVPNALIIGFTTLFKNNHVPPCSPPLSGRIIHQVARVYQLPEQELTRVRHKSSMIGVSWRISHSGRRRGEEQGACRNPDFSLAAYLWIPGLGQE